MSAALLPAFAVAALLLAVAGAAKVVSPRQTQSALAVAGLRTPLVAVRALGAGEVAVGGAAFLQPSAVTALAAALAYAAFAVFTLRLLRTGAHSVDCGCFGGAGSEAGPLHLALNGVAFAVCLAAAAAPPPPPDWVLGRPPLTALAICIGVGAAAYASYLTFTALPRAWRSYGTGGGS